MIELQISKNKKVYFASDFHLGFPDAASSLDRERKLVSWLESIESNASHLFLMGDVFDFWFEYGKTVPAGFTRFLGKLAQLADAGIQLHIFVGNHDLWMWDYFEKELNAFIYREPTHLKLRFAASEKNLWVGHGDGLGPGDNGYKFLKKVFTNPLAQFLFKWLHPTFGMGIAYFWSETRKKKALSKGEDPFDEPSEFILNYIKSIQPLHEKQGLEISTYVFGHRHLPIAFPVSENVMYYNLGEWFTSQYINAYYLSVDEKSIQFEPLKA